MCDIIFRCFVKPSQTMTPKFELNISTKRSGRLCSSIACFPLIQVFFVCVGNENKSYFSQSISYPCRYYISNNQYLIADLFFTTRCTIPQCINNYSLIKVAFGFYFHHNHLYLSSMFIHLLFILFIYLDNSKLYHTLMHK